MEGRRKAGQDHHMWCQAGGLFLLAAIGSYTVAQCRARLDDIVGCGYEGLVDGSALISRSVSVYCGGSGIPVDEP